MLHGHIFKVNIFPEMLIHTYRIPWHVWLIWCQIKFYVCDVSGVSISRQSMNNTRGSVYFNHVTSIGGNETDRILAARTTFLANKPWEVLSPLHQRRAKLTNRKVKAQNVDNLKQILDEKFKEILPPSLSRMYFNKLLHKKSHKAKRFEKDVTKTLGEENIEKQAIDGQKLKVKGRDSDEAAAEELQPITSSLGIEEISQKKGIVYDGFGQLNLGIHGNGSLCNVEESTFGLIVDCTSLDLEHIDPHWFPGNTSIVLLDENALTTIPNGTFQHLSQLILLSVSSNKLKKLEVDSFIGLGKLEVLNLEKNELDLTPEVYPSSVFTPLVSLKELRLLQQIAIRQKSYPDGFFEYLKNLTVLSINTVGKTLYFGSEFKCLTNLKQLEITGNVHFMKNSSFENLGQLKTLRMDAFMSVQNVIYGLFEPLTQLDILDLSYLQIGLKETLEMLAPFEGRNMSMISLDAVNRYSHESYTSIISGDGILDAEKMKYLVKICVREIIFSRNKIFIIEESAFQDRYVLNKCLQRFDIIDNPIVGISTALLSLLQLQSLMSFTITGPIRNCSKIHQMPGRYATWNGMITSRKIPYSVRPTITYDSKHSFFVNSFRYGIHIDVTSQNSGTIGPKIDPINDNSSFSESHSVKDENSIFFRVSSSLKHLAMQSLIESGYFSDSYTVSGAEGVIELDLSNNNFQDFSGTISGFTGLKTLLLSGNYLAGMSSSFFDTFQNLENLDLSSCNLETTFMREKGDRVFKYLIHLKRLDLSFNVLSLLAKDTFSWNSKMEGVFLSGNRFREIPFDLKNTPNLKVLDIRENSLTTITNDIILELDALSLKSNAFHLYLSGNILSCSCSNLHFLQWIFITNVIIDNNKNLTCMDSSGVLTHTSAFLDIEAVWRTCRGEFFFSVSLVIFCVMCLGYLTVFVLIRNKLYITYSLLKLLGGVKLKSTSDYNIGVFIGYADKDYRFPCSDLRVYIEESLGLSTYILDRDLSLSCDTASSISHAIHCSWRTVLVITERFLGEDPWGMFTLRSAVYSQTADNPDRVVVVVEQRLQHLLPIEVVGSIPEDNIVFVPRLTMDYELKEKLRTRIVMD